VIILGKIGMEIPKVFTSLIESEYDNKYSLLEIYLHLFHCGTHTFEGMEEGVIRP
jgi:hypothetical protein